MTQVRTGTEPAKMTITEALAQLTTIGKRIEKKRTFIRTYLLRPEKLKDPLQKDGGSSVVLGRELQSITDLERRHVAIRLAIQKANQETQVTVEGITKSLAEWLTWRKEIAPGLQNYLGVLQGTINNVRQQALKQGSNVVKAGEEAKTEDVISNLDEAYLAKEAEELELILGSLDGQLSLKNATVYIEA